MKIKVTLNGMDKVEEAMRHARSCMNELENAVNEVYAALASISAEMTQPPDETDG